MALRGDARTLSLQVIDNGQSIALPLLRGRPGHLGIVGMRERATAIGGRFSVAAHKRGGTCVNLDWAAPP